MLDQAIDHLRPATLGRIAKRHLDLEKLRFENEDGTRRTLLATVKAFDAASRAGEYYQSFKVNSENYLEQSSGTMTWIAMYRRLLDRCVTDAKKNAPVEAREAFDILFALLDHIDRCLDDIIFFADEGGSWQVPVDWDRVLPSWFRVLSATAGPQEYAERITAVLEHHYNYGRDTMLVIARRTATPEQREVLADAARRYASRSRGGVAS